MRWLLAAVCLTLTTVSGQVVEGRFIVELEADAATPLSPRRMVARGAIEGRSGRVVHNFDRVLDGFVVQAPHLTAGDLERLPGVKKVYPVVTGRLHLDQALNVNGIIGAWVKLGAWELAGLGMKIGIIDSGIDKNHPGFRDDGLPVPDGYPRGNRESDLSGTNNKVIVARSYEDLLPGSSEATTVDRVGHGTAVAMVAAGVPHYSPIGVLWGAAPKAYLGSYKIFGGPEDTTTSDILIRALDDAVKDGMDVVNLSAGFTPVSRPEDDPMVRAVERATAMGVIVVQSAGNSGPEPATTSSPGQSETVVTVGAQPNSRVLMATVTVGENLLLAPALAATIRPAEPLTGPIADVGNVDGTGLACAPLPTDSLAGHVALIFRGECDFQDKLNHAQAAGAMAAVIYTNQNPVGAWDPQQATLPALMISNAAGLAIKRRLAEAPGLTMTLRFENGAFPVDPQHVSEFSSRGPSVAGRIQPNLLAVGEFVYTAAPGVGEEGAPARYRTVDGTSFSAPLVAGSAAVVKGVRPNLLVRQYGSLLTNTASPVVVDGNPVPVLSGGAGSLNLEAALGATATAVPATLSFGAGGGTVEIFRQVTVTNISKQVESYSVTATARRGPNPVLTETSFTLEPGAERWLLLSFNGTDLEPGHYEGVLTIQGSAGGAALRVPYWYGVKSGKANTIAIVNRPRSATAGTVARFYVKVLDETGTPVELAPEVSVVGDRGEVVGVRSIDRIFPGHWTVDVRLGAARGVNTFRIAAGEVSREVAVNGQ